MDISSDYKTSADTRIPQTSTASANEARPAQSVESHPPATASTPPDASNPMLRQREQLADLLRAYGFKATDENMEMLRLLRDNDLPLTKENMMKMNQAFKMTGDMEKALFLMMNGIRATSANAAQLNGLVDGQIKITAQIQQLLQAVNDISDPALRTLLLGILSGAENAEANGQTQQSPATAEAQTQQAAIAPENLAQAAAEQAQLPQAAATEGAPAPQAAQTAEAQAPQATQASQTTEAQASQTTQASQTAEAQALQTTQATPTTETAQALQGVPTSEAQTLQTAQAAQTTEVPQAASTAGAQAAAEQAQPQAAPAAEAPQTAQPLQGAPTAEAAQAPQAARTTEAAQTAEASQTAQASNQSSNQAQNQAPENEMIMRERNSFEAAVREQAPQRGENSTNLAETARQRFSFKLPNSTPRDVDEFLNTLRDTVNQIRTALRGSQAENPETARVLRSAQALAEHIDFTAQIKQQIFVQLPVAIGQQEMQTALHVYKDAKSDKKKGASGSHSALIALDTAFLGHFETYVQKQAQSVTCQFRLESPEIEQLVRTHIHELNRLLQEYHYSLDGFSFLPSGEPYTLLNTPEKSQEATDNGESGRAFSVDIRA